MNWWEWVFSGVGVLTLGLRIEWLRRRSHSAGTNAALTAQESAIRRLPVARAPIRPSATHITITTLRQLCHQHQRLKMQSCRANTLSLFPTFGTLELNQFCFKKSRCMAVVYWKRTALPTL